MCLANSTNIFLINFRPEQSKEFTNLDLRENSSPKNCHYTFEVIFRRADLQDWAIYNFFPKKVFFGRLEVEADLENFKTLLGKM